MIIYHSDEKWYIYFVGNPILLDVLMTITLCSFVDVYLFIFGDYLFIFNTADGLGLQYSLEKWAPRELTWFWFKTGHIIKLYSDIWGMLFFKEKHS